jgi:hypothetical protein
LETANARRCTRVADLANFGEMDCGSNRAVAKSIPVPIAPLAAYYRYGGLIAALVGAQQNIRARMEQTLRGESIGHNGRLASVGLSEPMTPSEAL